MARQIGKEICDRMKNLNDSLEAVTSTPAEPSTLDEGTRQDECPYVTGTVTKYCTLTPFTLTDAEREAVDWAAYAAEKWYEHTAADTLRGLLERTR
jgi:hypothetical protein